MINGTRTLLFRLTTFVRRRPAIVAASSLVVLMMVFAVAVTVAKADNGQSGTTLTAQVSATPNLTKTFHWSIAKSVTPATWNLFAGDSGTSTYTIAVTKDTGTIAAWLDGQVCIQNGGSVDTQNLAIQVVLTNPSGSTTYNTASVDVSSSPAIPAGGNHCYDYSIAIPAADITPGATYKVTANVTITNHSGHLGTPFGPSPSNTAQLPATPSMVNDTVNVSDTNGQSFSFSDSGQQTYTQTFTCNGDQGTHNNTATITDSENPQPSASASVTVTCYHLDVSKTANTSLTRTYQWNVAKFGDQSNVTLALNQSFPVNYTVTVAAGHTDSAWAVAGTVTVDNPAPMAATVNGVADTMSGTGAIALSCPVTFPYSLAAGGDLTCSYTSALPDATSRTNTATATLQNESYASDGSPTAGGTTDFSGQANADFSSATIIEVDKSVTVSDSLAGPLGVLTYNGTDGVQHTYTYSGTVGPFAVCGPRTITNRASFITDDTQTTGSDSWTVSVSVPCNQGCTLTIGYWKTHAGFTGNNADMVTQHLPIWLGTPSGTSSVYVTSASQAATILGYSGSASNGIYKLEGQLLAAKLNITSGADPTAISSTIGAADSFLTTHSASSWSSLSKAQQAQVLSWVTALDNYNNGLTGPGHCSQ